MRWTANVIHNLWIKSGVLAFALLSFLPASAQDDPALAIQKAIENGELAQAQSLLQQGQLSEFQQGYLTGWLQLKQNKSDAALATWQTLRERFPTSLELGNNLAVLLMQNKRFDEAQQILEKTLHADRQVSKALDNLNKIYSYQAQQAYNNVFRRIEPEVPQGTWLALTEKSDVAVVEAAFAEMDAVLSALEGWRQAWSNKQVASYLNAYDSEFVPPQGQSLAAWKNARKRSLSSPRFIDVFLSNTEITPLADDLVRVTFVQRYRSDRFRDEVNKVLLLKLRDGQWKIVQETVTS
ncbi:MAG: tetratricopeptide repeat protein [Thiomicrospira sp.]|nr:tetratricopeptide repeat protein [Thiomicrospira sp.]